MNFKEWNNGLDIDLKIIQYIEQSSRTFYDRVDLEVFLDRVLERINEEHMIKKKKRNQVIGMKVVINDKVRHMIGETYEFRDNEELLQWLEETIISYIEDYEK